MKSEVAETKNVRDDQRSLDDNSKLGQHRSPMIKLAWVVWSLIIGFVFIPGLLLVCMVGGDSLTRPSLAEFKSLERGMSREQVRAILGDPSFVAADGGWDYGQGWNDGVMIEFGNDGCYSSFWQY